jgi:hypothetical protein
MLNSLRLGKRWRIFCAGVLFLGLMWLAAYLLPLGHNTDNQTSGHGAQLKEDSKLIAPADQSARASANNAASFSGGQISHSSLVANAEGKDNLPEVCGLGKEDVQAMMSSKSMALTGEASRTVAAQAARLIQSERVRDKALGLFMYVHQAQWAALDAEHLNQPGCDAKPECNDKPFETSRRARANAAEPLVKLALSSGDIDAYAIALYACQGMKTGLCGSVTYERWSQMEPNNAVAWLSLASRAELRGDAQAQILALQRAVTAADFNTRTPTFDAVSISSLLPAGDPLEAWAVGNMLLLMSMFNGDQYSGVGRYCSRIGKDPDINRSICDSLATKLEQNDQSLTGGAIAATIGEKLGWPSERVQLLKDERTVARGYDWEINMGKDNLTCASLEQRRKWMAKSLLKGERAMARDVVSKSGKSLAEVAADYRTKIPDYLK